MIFNISEDDDGNLLWEFDGEAIDYLIIGLGKLIHAEPGTIIVAPVVITGDKTDDPPTAVSNLLILRAQD